VACIFRQAVPPLLVCCTVCLYNTGYLMVTPSFMTVGRFFLAWQSTVL
jgi:hypothetical protein